MTTLQLGEDGRAILLDGAWRGVVEPHDNRTLDALTQERALTPDQRQTISDTWADIPLPPEPPVRSPVNPRQTIIDRLKGDSVLRALIMGVTADKGWTETQMLDWLEASDA